MSITEGASGKPYDFVRLGALASEKGTDVKKTRWTWPLGGANQGMLLLVAGFVSGCYPKAGPAPGPVSADGVQRAYTRWPGVTAESLTAGHDLFISNCNKCHDYPDLTAIDEDKWPGIVKRMGNKADLAPPQIDLVLHFILAARSEQPAKP
jgi:hypothetical protein